MKRLLASTARRVGSGATLFFRGYLTGLRYLSVPLGCLMVLLFGVGLLAIAGFSGVGPSEARGAGHLARTLRKMFAPSGGLPATLFCLAGLLNGIGLMVLGTRSLLWAKGSAQ